LCWARAASTAREASRRSAKERSGSPNSGDGTVSRIDPETNEVVETIAVGHRPEGIAVAGGLVWVTVRD
jgi:YVTN family beta-propeller protein